MPLTILSNASSSNEDSMTMTSSAVLGLGLSRRGEGAIRTHPRTPRRPGSMRPDYSGIGISNGTWNSYGATSYACLAGLATKDQQILIGMKVTRDWVPDQYDCDAGGW